MRSKLSDAAQLGQFLAALRSSHGRTQEQVAELLGVDVETISRMERGATWPTLPRLMSLADLYNVSVGSLLQQRSPRSKDIAEELENQLARLTTEDQVWVREWVTELCNRLAAGSQPVRPMKKQRR
ncbi:helix-turn-helix domain-containing protein (plasmid) [Ralstonia sp. 25C]|uniref:helix-turn-helix domain-containing protein n=1 Tax=Ralstonia sp. 25C TaxID=3447363 RepID=UPI003F74D8FE